MLSTGYATLAGSGKRCPAVMSTARAAGTIAVSATAGSRAGPQSPAGPNRGQARGRHRDHDRHDLHHVKRVARYRLEVRPR